MCIRDSPFCEDQNISILPYNPVAKGFLSGKYNRNTKNESIRFKTDPGFAAKFFKPEDFDVLDMVIQIANEKDVKPAQIAIAWLLTKTITSPIIGVTKKSHVEEAVDALDIKLTNDDIERLEEPYQVHSIHHL